MTRLTSWSTSSTAVPSEASDRTSAAKVAVSWSLRPEAGSSSRRRRGRAASARPSSHSRARPTGSASARSSCDRAQADAIDDGLGVASRVRLEVVRPPPPNLGGDQDVLAHAQAPEHLQLLKRAGDTETGPRARRLARDVVIAEDEPAGAHRLQAGDRVEDRRLARTVRADETGDAGVVHVEIGPVHRVVPAEADREPASLKQRHRTPPRSSRARGRARGPRRE